MKQLFTLVVLAGLALPRPAGTEDAENVYHFAEYPLGSCGDWEPVGRTTLSAGLWSFWDPGSWVEATIRASHAGQMVHGMHQKGLRLPLPKSIRFRVWSETGYLFVVLGDTQGRRMMSTIPLGGVKMREWSEVEVALDDLFPMGVGAEPAADFDSIAILTREPAGEHRLLTRLRYFFKDFRAVYPEDVGPADPPQPTPEDLEAVLAPLADRIERIDALLAQAGATGIDTRYPMVSRTVLERYRTELRDMLIDDSRFFTMNSARWLVGCAERTETELKAMLADPGSVIPYPEVSLASLQCREGTFFSGGRPVILTGPCGWFQPAQFDELSKMGYTCVSTETGPRHTLPEPGVSKPPEGIRAVLDAAQAHNMAVDLLLSPHYFPGWAREQWPGTDAVGLRKRVNNFMPWTVTDPHFREVIAKHLAVTIPYLRDHPALLSYDLINEAWYRALADYPVGLLTEFRADNPDVGEYQALSRVSTNTVTEFLDWNIKELHKYDTSRPVHIKAIDTPASLSVDREAICDVLTASGMDAMQSWPDFSGRLAADLAWPLLRHDFHRSLHPDNPIMDGEYHMVAGAGDGRFMPDRYAYAALWALALHGRDMGCNWVYGRPDGASVYWHVNAVEALGRTSLDLLRLAPEVHAFQRQRSGLAMYFGGLETSHAYLACLFQDLDVGIVTDKRILDGKLDDYRVLVLPWPNELAPSVQRRVDAFAERGGRVVELPAEQPVETLYERVQDVAAPVCEKPKVYVGAWGVECRSVELNGRRLFYVLNHGRQPVTLRPQSKWKLGNAVDLRTNKPVDARALVLDPLELRLIEAL